MPWAKSKYKELGAHWQDPNAALIEVLKNKGYHLTKVEKGGVVCRG